MHASVGLQHVRGRLPEFFSSQSVSRPAACQLVSQLNPEREDGKAVGPFSVFCKVRSNVFIGMDQHLCVVQTVDRNPFKSIGTTSRCPRTGQTKRRRSKCLVSYLVSLVVGRKGTSSHAPLLADSFY